MGFGAEQNDLEPGIFLLIERLQKFHHYDTNKFKLECPTGSGQYLSLPEVANELSKRLIGIFSKDANGNRAVFRANSSFQNDPNWHDLIPFHEYFHGNNGAGIGASHQTGWMGLVAKLIHQQGLGKKKAEFEESAG